MTVAILIHGINVTDGGRGSVGKLRPFFVNLGIPYVMVTYGWMGPITPRLRNRSIARTVATAVSNAQRDDRHVIVVGHSNGCAIAYLAAAEFGARLDHAVFINPALDADIEIPPGIGGLHVWHSPSDVPLRLAKLLLWSKARPWGEMGATGYTGTSSRVVNFNKEAGFEVSSDQHSDMFDAELIAYFGARVAGQSAAALGVIPEKGVDSEGVRAGELRETGGVAGISAAGEAPAMMTAGGDG